MSLIEFISIILNIFHSLKTRIEDFVCVRDKSAFVFKVFFVNVIVLTDKNQLQEDI